MSSKPKSKTFIVHHRVYTHCAGRYRIGARNSKEAEQMLRDKLGKHINARTYYEDQNKVTPYGVIIKEC